QDDARKATTSWVSHQAPAPCSGRVCPDDAGVTVDLQVRAWPNCGPRSVRLRSVRDLVTGNVVLRYRGRVLGVLLLLTGVVGPRGPVWIERRARRAHRASRPRRLAFAALVWLAGRAAAMRVSP